jgi:hypothetical protein
MACGLKNTDPVNCRVLASGSTFKTGSAEFARSLSGNCIKSVAARRRGSVAGERLARKQNALARVYAAVDESFNCSMRKSSVLEGAS